MEVTRQLSYSRKRSYGEIIDKLSVPKTDLALFFETNEKKQEFVDTWNKHRFAVKNLILLH